MVAPILVVAALKIATMVFDDRKDERAHRTKNPKKGGKK